MSIPNKVKIERTQEQLLTLVLSAPVQPSAFLNWSTRAKMMTHFSVNSSLAGAGSKSSDTNGLCLSHSLSRATSLQRRPFVRSRYALQKHARSLLSSSRGNHTLFSLLVVRLPKPRSSNVYLGKMKQRGKVTRGRGAEGMTQL